MECLLLWLDDLDDLIFSAAVSWPLACRLSLTPGLTAAVVLITLYGRAHDTPWTLVLSTVAACSVLAWLSAAVPALRRPLAGSPAAA